MSDVRDTAPLPRTVSNDAACVDARAMLDGWRAAGDDRVDPLRFAAIDALARRIAKLSPSADGEWRRLLDARLAALVAAYAEEVGSRREVVEAQREASKQAAQAAQSEPDSKRKAQAEPTARSGHANPHHDTSLAALTAFLNGRPGRADALSDSLLYFQTMWSKLSAGRQLRQSLAQVPGNAGPLNSNRLMYRALSLMNELSPEYLRQFLSYAQTLSALGDLIGGGSASAAEEPGAESEPRSRHAKGAKPALRRKSKSN
ncbi:DUF2894 domain-containing protein [Paraburkholderia sp. SARCC-3016]|uniref:DUF2894 domain-containing protein n=1 Tax=Paraburkholderia sp. SARCC-3016 TaxID=3058611 RepID=UPI0028084B7E|nr:DUF2894 domain-containing protein [Paraburkholderia sp. SARCC-3016]MDQ7977275.1 DUF2894 domain-containing protein [Paraburkholderia sp. SARCC-3016]